MLFIEGSAYNFGNLPFTIVRLMNQTEVLYMKEDIEKGTLIWPQIMKQSNNWKFRHVEYLEDHFMKIKQEASAQ